MTELPRITIEETPVNDMLLLLDAVLAGPDLLRVIDDPASLYSRYRGELRIVRQYLLGQTAAQPAPAAADAASPVDQPFDGSILR
jgi:hypothetical protein